MIDLRLDMTDEKIFTEKELELYNGERGRSIYIAYAGIVYEVTHAPKWQTGLHEDLHYSGLDLTRSLPKAPHGEEVFVRPDVKRVGRLINDRA
jgi:predicted heme/steroid binding protein